MRRLEPNQAGEGALTLLTLGGGVALVSALIWANRKKPTQVVTTTPQPLPPPPVPVPAPQVPVSPFTPAVAPPTCGVTKLRLNQWGTDQNLSVFYFPTQLVPPDWAQMQTIPTLADILALPGGIDRIVVVLGDNSFWAFGPSMVVAPSPADRDSYCLWYEQHLQAGNV